MYPGEVAILRRGKELTHCHFQGWRCAGCGRPCTRVRWPSLRTGQELTCCHFQGWQCAGCGKAMYLDEAAILRTGQELTRCHFQGWRCAGCERAMYPGEVAIFADRAGTNKCWHPGCFSCARYGILLPLTFYSMQKTLFRSFIRRKLTL
jgi:hypothetical protein